MNNNLLNEAISWANYGEAYAQSQMWANRNESTSMGDIVKACSRVELLKDAATKEVRQYSDSKICFTNSNFPSNHLYCVRGKACDFAEVSDLVFVYLHR